MDDATRRRLGIVRNELNHAVSSMRDLLPRVKRLNNDLDAALERVNLWLDYEDGCRDKADETILAEGECTSIGRSPWTPGVSSLEAQLAEWLDANPRGTWRSACEAFDRKAQPLAAAANRLRRKGVIIPREAS